MQRFPSLPFLKQRSPRARQQTGFSLIELLLAIGIMAIFLPALLIGFSASRSGRPQLEQRQEAIQLVREGQEAVRVVRERDWEEIDLDDTKSYYPVINNNTWELVAGTQTVSGTFTRTITFDDVYRDPSGTIVPEGTAGAVIDPSTKKVTTTVHWNTPIPTSVASTLYLTRFENTVHTDTAAGDFQAGQYASGISVTDTAGGELTLGAGGAGGDWCTPQQNIVGSYDLTHSGVPIAITAATGSTQDIAYTTTGNNASGYTVDHIMVSHNAVPDVKDTNAITGPKGYGIFTDGSYVYVNENTPPNHTVLIANSSDLSTVGYFDVKNGTGTSVAVSGNTGYTTVGSALYAFDVTQKTGARPQKGTPVTLAGTGNKVVLVGTNAYVVTNNSSKQLQIIDTTSMTVTKTLNLGNSLAGVDVAVDPTEHYAYVATAYAAGKKNFFIIDLQNTGTVWGYSTNGMNPKGIIIPAANRALLVGAGGELYQVFDITTPSAAFHCGGMSPVGVTSINAVAGVARSDGTVYSYIITDNSSAEFQIIQGGAGGPGGKYVSAGTYESATFDATRDVAFNYFYVTATTPPSTAITYQLAIKHGSVSGGSTTCSGVAFSDADFITFTPGQIPLSAAGYVNPGQCLRYRILLSTTNTDVTPTLYDISFNYSL